MVNTIITRRKSTVLKKSVILHRQIAEEMKYRTVFLLVALAVSVMTVACYKSKSCNKVLRFVLSILATPLVTVA